MLAQKKIISLKTKNLTYRQNCVVYCTWNVCKKPIDTIYNSINFFSQVMMAYRC